MRTLWWKPLRVQPTSSTLPPSSRKTKIMLCLKSQLSKELFRSAKLVKLTKLKDWSLLHQLLPLWRKQIDHKMSLLSKIGLIQKRSRKISHMRSQRLWLSRPLGNSMQSSQKMKNLIWLLSYQGWLLDQISINAILPQETSLRDSWCLTQIMNNFSNGTSHSLMSEMLLSHTSTQFWFQKQQDKDSCLLQILALGGEKLAIGLMKFMASKDPKNTMFQLKKSKIRKSSQHFLLIFKQFGATRWNTITQAAEKF